MSQTNATLTVQFSPFRLRLMRDTGGVWIAAIFHAGSHDAIVTISDTAARPETYPAVRVVDGHPRLCIGGAVLPLPTRQLRRVSDWLATELRRDFGEVTDLSAAPLPPEEPLVEAPDAAGAGVPPADTGNDDGGCHD